MCEQLGVTQLADNVLKTMKLLRRRTEMWYLPADCLEHISGPLGNNARAMEPPRVVGGADACKGRGKRRSLVLQNT